MKSVFLEKSEKLLLEGQYKESQQTDMNKLKKAS